MYSTGKKIKVKGQMSQRSKFCVDVLKPSPSAITLKQTDCNPVRNGDGVAFCSQCTIQVSNQGQSSKK